MKTNRFLLFILFMLVATLILVSALIVTPSIAGLFTLEETTCEDVKISALSCNAFQLSDGNYLYDLAISRGNDNAELRDILFSFSGSGNTESKGSEAQYGVVPKSGREMNYGIREKDKFNFVDISAILDSKSCPVTGKPIPCYFQNNLDNDNTEVTFSSRHYNGGGGGGSSGGGGGNNEEETSTCGNFVLESGEQCDLGSLNGIEGSGCSNSCLKVSTYCAEVKAGERTGEGPKASADFISEKYFVPENKGILSEPEIENIIINGVLVRRISFDFQPFKESYSDNKFTADWSHKVIVYIPKEGYSRDSAVASMNIATGNGNPSDIDPIRDKNEIPSWYKGTETEENFQLTYASIAADYKVPVIFYDPVPEEITFSTEIQQKLREYQEVSSPTFICDDNLCSGTLTDDGDINQCLTGLSFINYPSEEFINYQSSVFYSVAMGRALDATKIVLSELSGEEFNFQTVVAMGGSKRGAGTEKFIAIDERVKGGYVASANGGNYLQYYLQRESLWKNSFGPLIYDDASDSFNFLSGKTEHMNRYDPFYWAPEVLGNKKMLRSWGTDDSYFQTSAESAYIDAFSEYHLLGLPNYAHGFGTVDQAVAFRNLVDYIINGNEMISIDANWDLTENKVYATFVNVEPDKVDLYCTVDETTLTPPSLHQFYDCSAVPDEFKGTPPDMRYARWDKVEMIKGVDGRYSAIPMHAEDGKYTNYQACLVRASSGVDDSVITSRTLLNRNLCEESLFSVKDL